MLIQIKINKEFKISFFLTFSYLLSPHIFNKVVYMLSPEFKTKYTHAFKIIANCFLVEKPLMNEIWTEKLATFF